MTGDPPLVRLALALAEAKATIEERDATIARVRALAEDWPCSDETCDGECTGCAYGRDLLAALDGLETPV